MIQGWISTNPPVLGSCSRPCPASQPTASHPTLQPQEQGHKELNNILMGW